MLWAEDLLKPLLSIDGKMNAVSSCSCMVTMSSLVEGNVENVKWGWLR
jgi:hypothetical protein